MNKKLILKVAKHIKESKAAEFDMSLDWKCIGAHLDMLLGRDVEQWRFRETAMGLTKKQTRRLFFPMSRFDGAPRGRVGMQAIRYTSTRAKVVKALEGIAAGTVIYDRKLDIWRYKEQDA